MTELYLNIAKTEHEIQFLYKTRRRRDIDAILLEGAPGSLEQHTSYLSEVQEKTRWIYVAKARNLVKGNRVETTVGCSQIYNVTASTLELGFAIHPDYQGKGYGKDLVLKTITEAENMFPDKTVILYVLRNNKKAIHIYEKLGFFTVDLTGTDSETLGMELLR